MTRTSKELPTERLGISWHTSTSPPTTCGLDTELYLNALNSSDLTDKQKSELLAALWSIIVAFIDLSYGVHPAQRAGADDTANAEMHSLAKSFLLSEHL